MAVDDSFNATARFFPAFGAGIGIDAKAGRFAVLGRTRPLAMFSFTELVAVDVKRDGSSIHLPNRKSQAVGMLVGGVLLGPLGTLIGGLSVSTRTEQIIRSLELKLITSRLDYPSVTTRFFYSKEGKNFANQDVQNSLILLEIWHDKFYSILNSTEEFVSNNKNFRIDEKEILSGAAWHTKNAPISSYDPNVFYKIIISDIGKNHSAIVDLVAKLIGAGRDDIERIMKSTPFALRRSFDVVEVHDTLAALRKLGASAHQEKLPRALNHRLRDG